MIVDDDRYEVEQDPYQDVYTWAGKYRTSRGGNAFCYPEYIEATAAELFRTLDQDVFAGARSERGSSMRRVNFLASSTPFTAFAMAMGARSLRSCIWSLIVPVIRCSSRASSERHSYQR